MVVLVHLKINNLLDKYNLCKLFFINMTDILIDNIFVHYVQKHKQKW